MDTMESGSIKDWTYTPNLTPRGHEIKKDELYVINGDVLIKAYHLLMNQRVSTLLALSKIPPTEVAVYEEYLSMSKHINMVLYHVLNSLPLVSVLQAQSEARIEEENRTRLSTVSGLTLKEILKKYHLTEGGKDELKKPPPENDKPTA